jgi:hypothetical protein
MSDPSPALIPSIHIVTEFWFATAKTSQPIERQKPVTGLRDSSPQTVQRHAGHDYAPSSGGRAPRDLRRQYPIFGASDDLTMGLPQITPLTLLLSSHFTTCLFLAFLSVQYWVGIDQGTYGNKIKFW